VFDVVFVLRVRFLRALLGLLSCLCVPDVRRMLVVCGATDKDAADAAGESDNRLCNTDDMAGAFIFFLVLERRWWYNVFSIHRSPTSNTLCAAICVFGIAFCRCISSLSTVSRLPLAARRRRSYFSLLGLDTGSANQSRGLAGFFAGSTLRISRKAFSSAIGWSVYEGLLLGLRDRKVLG
jgi:hypothetical protein